MKAKFYLFAVLVLVALFVVPVALAQEGEPVDEAPTGEDAGDEAPVEDDEGVDLDAITEDLSRILVVAIVSFLAVVTNEVGFEKLISLPLIEKHAKALKAYQPYMVLVVAVLLLWLTKVDVYAGLAEITNMLSDLPGDSNFIAGGAIVGLLSLAYHDRKKAG